MGYKVLNNAFSTLAGAINAAATSITVATGHGDRFPVIAGADYTYITFEDSSGNIEIVKVTARATASDVMTIARGQDGTVARSWAAGDIVELRIVAALLDFAIAHVDDTTDAHLASAIKNIPAGSLNAVTVQAALNELDSDISALASAASAALNAHLNDTSDAHDASAISYAGGTGISATDVEGALDELANEKLNLAGGTVTGDIVMSGASIVEAEGAAVAAASTTNIWATDGNTIHITGNTTITSFGIAPQAGARMKLIFDGTPLLTHSADLNLNAGSSNIQIEAGDYAEVYADTTTQMDVVVRRKSGRAVVEPVPPFVTVRQSIQYGPYSAAGQPDLIPQSQVGNTLAAGVTLKGSTAAFMASVGNGFNSDGTQRNLNKVRSTDLNIPNLSGSTTNYIWYDTVSDTAGFVTVADAFQAGGTIPVTNNQYTYDYLNHIMYLGNGSSASQSNRIIVAEVDTNGTVVTAIRVRAYQGESTSDEIAIPAANTSTTFSHNIGKLPSVYSAKLRCKTSEFGYSVGDEVDITGATDGDGARTIVTWASATVVGYNCSGVAPLIRRRDGTNAGLIITSSNWRLVFRAWR